MPKPRPIPGQLGATFTVRAAAEAGVSRERLRRSDLERPFRGIRSAPEIRHEPTAPAFVDPYAQQAAAHRALIQQYAPRLAGTQFISHESAATLWGAPLPLVRTAEGEIAPPEALRVHVSTFGDGHLIRASGVRAHRARHRTSRYTHVDRIPVADVPTTWCSLGHLPLIDLVAAGDYFCRVWRDGFGRRDAGRAPLSTIDRLQAALDAGRRTGVTRLRDAIELIREDSWSPKESTVRCHLMLAGLPEPKLNHDIYDRHGTFLGCVDLAYPDRKIAIEYQSILHHDRYSTDVERLAALRAAGWIVIEVTSAALATPEIMVSRVRAALRSRR